jgi:hypothetical protein
MTLRRVDLLFLAAVGLVVAGVSLLPSPRDQNPIVPADAEHRGVAVEAECRRCHPKRTDCLRCHARAVEETH